MLWSMSDDIAVRAEDLTKFYGTRRGIEGLTLEVRAGEVMGFLGPNGAGKTTTIRLLLDFLRPTRGNVVVLMQQEFLALVREARANGQTVFMSSHVLAEVQQTADRVATVRDGRIRSRRRERRRGSHSD